MKKPKTSGDKADEKFFPIFTLVHTSADFTKRTQQSDYNHAYDEIVWRMIFEEVYGEEPIHDGTLPHHYAKGVTDPRWNVLLHTDEAYPAYIKFLALTSN